MRLLNSTYLSLWLPCCSAPGKIEEVWIQRRPAAAASCRVHDTAARRVRCPAAYRLAAQNVAQLLTMAPLETGSLIAGDYQQEADAALWGYDCLVAKLQHLCESCMKLQLWCMQARSAECGSARS